jgi:hypothetical protein
LINNKYKNINVLNIIIIFEISKFYNNRFPELIPDIEKCLPVAIFKMAATIPHKFNIVWFQRPELIPDIEKFPLVSIFKLADTIPQKFKVAFDLIFRCQESFRDIIIYPHMKCRWNRTMLNLCSIVAAILKMATGRNFSMSGINSGHHNLPTYEMLKNFYRSPFSKWPPQFRKYSTLSDIIKIWYVGR